MIRDPWARIIPSTGFHDNDRSSGTPGPKVPVEGPDIGPRTPE